MREKDSESKVGERIANDALVGMQRERDMFTIQYLEGDVLVVRLKKHR